MRSNYLRDEAAHLYDFALDLWPPLGAELGFNVMFSARGVLNLGHSLQDMRDIERRVSANLRNGIDGEVLSVSEVAKKVDLLDCSPCARYPVLGASWQPRGGVARHDAVAWGFARAADALGVDLLQQTAVTGIRLAATSAGGRRVTGVETDRGFIAANRVACVAAGHSGVLAAMAGLRLPIESRPLQALVSEPLKPCLDTVVMSGAVHGYVSQADKGDLVIGAGTDGIRTLRKRGSSSRDRGRPYAIGACCRLHRVRMNRHWAASVDLSPDACPIIGDHRCGGFYSTAVGATGAFKATPARARLRRHHRQRPPHPLRPRPSAGPLPHTAPGSTTRRRRPRGDTGSLLSGKLASPCRRLRQPFAFRVANSAKAREAALAPLHCRRPPNQCCRSAALCAEERSEEEFSAAGRACSGALDPRIPRRPGWADYLHFRNNPKGPHAELWRHAAGCGRYFRVVRDTASYEILEVAAMDAPPPEPAKTGGPA